MNEFIFLSCKNTFIHTDFENNFIRAETVTCEDFIKYGSTEKCKENGKLRIEGKDYIVKDGDVLYFRVNPWPNLLHAQINKSGQKY